MIRVRWSRFADRWSLIGRFCGGQTILSVPPLDPSQRTARRSPEATDRIVRPPQRRSLPAVAAVAVISLLLAASCATRRSTESATTNPAPRTATSDQRTANKRPANKRISDSGASSDSPAHEDSRDAAAAYFAMKRGLIDGFNPHPLYDAARAQMARKSRLVAEAVGGPLIGNWTELGPTNAGGRMRAIVIDQHDPQVMYAAAVSGGVFKSVNAGKLWANTGDAMANLDVSSWALDPDDSRVIYAGTGEGYYREDVRGTALVIRGNGIFVSRDAGATWSQLPASAGDDFDFVNDLVVSHHDPKRIYAATRTGVWRSPDGGDSWTSVLPTTVKGGCLDLALRGDTDGDFLFASCGTFEQATVYRNKNAESATAWQSVLTDPNMGRTSLAIAPSNPNIIYALAASNAPGDYYQGLLAVFRSDQSGDSGSWSTQIRIETATDYVSTLLLTNPLGALSSQC